MVRNSILLLLSLVTYSYLAHSNPTVSAQDLLKESDRARGAATDGISWQISVETTEKDETTMVSYLVKARGVDALAEAIAPARNKGETMLFNDRNIWFFKPGLKKPVSISPRQKLMGQAANGDIASTNYYRDYEGKIVGEDVVDSIPTWKLELKAKAKNVTYDGIRYWIAKKDKVGIKAEFLTVGGEIFKEATFSYGNKVTFAGQSYPFVSSMVITDRINPNKKTTIRYEQPKVEQLASSIFNVNNLLR